MTRIKEGLTDQGLCFAFYILAVSVLQQEGLCFLSNCNFTNSSEMQWNVN